MAVQLRQLYEAFSRPLLDQSLPELAFGLRDAEP